MTGFSSRDDEKGGKEAMRRRNKDGKRERRCRVEFIRQGSMECTECQLLTD